jgi:two-component system, sensor histidine kinase
MMKQFKLLNIIFIILFILMNNPAIGQVESMENQLQYVKGSTEKFELLLTISKEYWSKNPMKSVEYAQAALKIGTEEGNDIQKARALNRIANGYYFLEQYKLALEYYLKSLDLSELNNYAEGIASATNNVGLIYQVMGDYDMSIEYYHKSLELQQKQNNKPGIADASLNIGNIYYYVKNYKKALYYFHQSLEIFTELKNEDGVLDVYNSIGSAYLDLFHPDSALYFFDLAYQLSGKINNLDKQATSLNNLGTAYFDKKKYKKALEYYDDALQIELGQEDLWLQANTIRNIGEVTLLLRDYEKSLNYFTRAAEIARNIGANRLLLDIYSGLSKYWEVKKDYKKSYEYLRLSNVLKDSIYNEASLNQIAEFEAKYSIRNKDQQLQMITKESKVQELQIKTQKYIIFIIASLSLFILTLFFVFYTRARTSKRAKKILEAKNIHITEQKIVLEKANAELKESDEKHVSLIKNIQDGIFVIQDEKIRFANESFSKIIGYPLDEVYELDFLRLIHPDDKDRIETNYRKRLAGENVPSSYEFKIVNKRGKMVHLSLSVGVINYLGKPAHIGTIKDITTLKKHEIELIKQKEKAEQATQSKSMFLAGMSHEIRNHMHSIIGISEMIAETKLNSEQKEYFNIIQSSGNELMNIINEILDFSKIEAGQVVLENIEFNLKELVAKIISMHEMQARQSNLYLKAEFQETLPEKLNGDPTRLGQILINLVNNAIKFTDKGGITVKVSHKQDYNLVSATDSIFYMVQFEVIDTGIGISKDSQQKLFKPFSQTHAAVQRKKGGTGLGLAICKQLTEMMNGEIGVISHLGKGSTFWFSATLSTFELNMQSSSAEPLGKLIYNKLKTKVIVIEDNLLNQQMTVNILVKEGYRVDMAENGKVGFDLYKKNRYDLVLMDIQMPVMDGIQATRLIRDYEKKNKLKKSVIIAVTAHTKEGEKQNLIDAGMNLYLSKPFKTIDLTEMLHNLKLS